MDGQVVSGYTLCYLSALNLWVCTVLLPFSLTDGADAIDDCSECMASSWPRWWDGDSTIPKPNKANITALGEEAPQK